MYILDCIDRELLYSLERLELKLTERCAPSGPQKQITKESDALHNQSTLLSIILSKSKMISFLNLSLVACVADAV